MNFEETLKRERNQLSMLTTMWLLALLYTLTWLSETSFSFVEALAYGSMMALVVHTVVTLAQIALSVLALYLKGFFGSSR